MKSLKFYSYIFFISCFLFTNCKNRGKGEKQLDTTTSGKITIAADESLKPIIDAEVKAFEAIYKSAKINVEYTSEGSAINKLMNGKVKLVIGHRKLTEDENQFFNKKQIYPKSLKIGINALALITHKDNTDTIISYEQLRTLFKGKIKEWKQIDKQSALKEINIIFDNDSAASVRFIKDSVAKATKLPSNCFAVDTNPKVIDYVSQNKSALGIIGVSWISDRDDTVTRGFLDKVKVLAVSKPGDEQNYDEYYQPYQAYIANGEYPLTHGIFIINAEPRIGLASGFTAFVAGDKGQRIILKSGLVPATMPVRIVKIKK